MVCSALCPTPPYPTRHCPALRPSLHTNAFGTTADYHCTPHGLTNNNWAAEAVMEKLPCWPCWVIRTKISHLCEPTRGTEIKMKKKCQSVPVDTWPFCHRVFTLQRLFTLKPCVSAFDYSSCYVFSVHTSGGTISIYVCISSTVAVTQIRWRVLVFITGCLFLFHSAYFSVWVSVQHVDTRVHLK